MLPTMQDYLQHVGAAASLAGYMIGSADIATIPGTVGECWGFFQRSVLHGLVELPDAASSQSRTACRSISGLLLQ